MTAAPGMRVVDLFSAAAGGWSLGMHRAGFTTIAACEAVEWRRILYAQNNPGVPIYEDVRTLTAERLLRDIGELPSIIVGSPPCQDISSANTKGKGVEGERSGLFFEAIRIIGECRPRWFALENSANIRTRGADAVLAALEDIGYACWPLVVRASDIGANHERPRSWLIGCDLGQVGNTNIERGAARVSPAAREGRDAFETGQLRPDSEPRRDCSLHAADAGCSIPAGRDAMGRRSRGQEGPEGIRPDGRDARETPDPDQAGQADGCMVASLRQEKIADDGRGDGWSADRSGIGQVAVCAGDRGDPDRAWPLWSLDDLAARLRLDARIPARLAGTRVAVGGPRGISAASLIVEAYGDAVVPQIPEAIGRAILRVERAMSALTQPARAEEG